MKSVNRVNVSPDNGFLSLKVFGIVWYFIINTKCIIIRNCFDKKTALVHPLVVRRIFEWSANVLYRWQDIHYVVFIPVLLPKLSAMSSGLHSAVTTPYPRFVAGIQNDSYF